MLPYHFASTAINILLAPSKNICVFAKLDQRLKPGEPLSAFVIQDAAFAFRARNDMPKAFFAF